MIYHSVLINMKIYKYIIQWEHNNMRDYKREYPSIIADRKTHNSNIQRRGKEQVLCNKYINDFMSIF